MGKNENQNGINFDLVDQLSFYGAYHSNPYNQIIHLICVPVIWFTFGVCLWYTGEIIPIPPASPAWLESFVGRIDGSFLIFLLYGVYYPLLDPVVGASATILYYIIYRQIVPFVGYFGESVAWKVALALNALSWYLQLHPGHIVLEKRRPALMDSAFQSFALAPLFVWYEVWFFFGYNPGLQKLVKSATAKKIAVLDGKSG